MSSEIRIFRGLDELSLGVAERLAESAEAAVKARGRFAVAFSGGSTPREMFRRLAGPDLTERVPWASCELFQVDERAVPPDHKDSNYRMIREELLTQVPAASERVHRMRAEISDLEVAADEYSSEIARVLAPEAGAWPRFDLILLGLGTDGHTASLFPGSAGLNEKKRWVIPNFAPRLGVWRLTLTYPVINAARKVVFLVAGEDKAETVRRVLDPREPAGSLPAQRIALADGQLEWYLDLAAGRHAPGAGVPVDAPPADAV